MTKNELLTILSTPTPFELNFRITNENGIVQVFDKDEMLNIVKDISNLEFLLWQARTKFYMYAVETHYGTIENGVVKYNGNR